MLNSTYVEYVRYKELALKDEKQEYGPKQKESDLVQDIITINGREATTTRGAQEILTQLAAEIAEEHKGESAFKNYKAREYSRFTVYRMLTDYHIETVRTPSANYYYVDELRALKDKLHPERGTHTDIKRYPKEKREEAIRLHQQQISNRQIALTIGVSFQTVNNWIRQYKQNSERLEKSS